MLFCMKAYMRAISSGAAFEYSLLLLLFFYLGKATSYVVFLFQNAHWRHVNDTYIPTSVCEFEKSQDSGICKDSVDH